MSASDHLSEQLRIPRYLYHYSPGDVVDSIKEKGLLTHNPQGESLAEQDGDPPGVYMFRDSEQAFILDDGDVWKVDTKGISLKEDPSNAGAAYYSEEPIPPHRLKHLGKSGR